MTTLLPIGCEEATQSLLEPATADSATTLINQLANAYQERDLALLESLLAHGPDSNARFHFVFKEDPQDAGPVSWDDEEEMRIHRRMFRPQETAGTGSPVGPELWPEAITVQWVQTRSFEEREDFYSEDGGADGKLDRSRWRVTDALYWTFAVFELQGDTDYAIDQMARFVILEDRAKNVGDAGMFRILQWEEIPVEDAHQTQTIHRSGWSLVKRLYR